MKRIGKLSLIVVVVAALLTAMGMMSLSVSAVTYGDDLIINGDFEQGASVSWGGSTAVKSGVGKDGSAALVSARPSTNGADTVTDGVFYADALLFKLLSGRTYRLSFDYKNEGDGYGQLSFGKTFGKLQDGTELSATSPLDLPKGDVSWTRLSYVFTTGNIYTLKGQELKFQSVGKAGTTYYDNITLTEVISDGAQGMYVLPSLQLPIDYQYELTATEIPSGKTVSDVTWKSSDEDIAMVLDDGTVRPKKGGTVAITATSTKFGTATCVVTVTPVNIVTNGDFEQGATSQWENKTDRVLEGVGKDNSWGLESKCTGERYPEDHQWAGQVIPGTGTYYKGAVLKSMQPNTTYEISFDYKHTGAGEGQIWVNKPYGTIVSTSGISKAGSNKKLSGGIWTKPGEVDWTHASVVFTTPEKPEPNSGWELNFRSTGGAGTVWYDNISIMQVVDINDIQLSTDWTNVTAGKTAKVEASVRHTAATAPMVTWSTEDATIATVKDGVITGVNPGVTKITASAEGMLPVSCYVTVVSEATLTDAMCDYTVKDGKATLTSVDKTLVGEVTVPAKLGGAPVTAIGAGAFADCTQVTKITLPATVTSIAREAFSNCAELLEITLPKAVKTIGEWAFYGCSKITEINIPAAVTSVGRFAFDGCYALEAVHITDLKAWCAVSFPNARANPLYFAKQLYVNNRRQSDMVIPDGVTAIKVHAFYNCVGLKSVTFPASVKTIGSSSFTNCENLTAITTKNGLTAIGASAFSGCAKLKSMVLAGSVKTVGASAFANCAALEKIEFHGNTAAWKGMNISSGNATFKAATVSILGEAKITKQPAPASTYPGVKKTFSVTATGINLKYQWQVKTSSTASWKNTTSAGYNTKTVSVEATEARDNYQYRCAVTGADGKTVYSKAVTLTVVSPRFTQQPTSINAAENTNAVFGVTATGINIKYQWQVKTTSTAAWKNSTLDGNTTTLLLVKATSARSGYQFRCVITDKGGNKAYSSVVKLTVVKPKITKQPVSVKAATGTTKTFSVSATGVGLKYQWQFAVSGSTRWINMSSTYKGYNTKTLSLGATAMRNGYKLRCVVTDEGGNTATSSAVTLTVVSAKVTKQPVSVKAAHNTKKTFTVTATGVGLKYQWQYRTSSTASWKNSTSTGYNTKTLTVAATTARNGYQYRCRVTDAGGNVVYSSAAKLTVSKPKVTKQPVSATVKAGTKKTFTVTATGVGLKYQWQYKTSSTASWKNSTGTGYKTKSLTVSATKSRNAYQYRLRITDAGGNVVYTKAVKLTAK